MIPGSGALLWSRASQDTAGSASTLAGLFVFTEPEGSDCGHWRVEKSYSTFKVRRGGSKEIPLIQGKEQRLCFAGAALKRYPMSKVREIQVRR